MAKSMGLSLLLAYASHAPLIPTKRKCLQHPASVVQSSPPVLPQVTLLQIVCVFRVTLDKLLEQIMLQGHAQDVLLAISKHWWGQTLVLLAQPTPFQKKKVSMQQAVCVGVAFKVSLKVHHQQAGPAHSVKQAHTKLWRVQQRACLARFIQTALPIQ